MGQLVVVLVGALVVAAIGFGVAALISTADPGLEPAEPDGRAVPLPSGRPLGEADLTGVRFDIALRGYRMAQVDAALRRAAYDLGYKQELIGVLEAEVAALREGRLEEAETLRRARESAKTPAATAGAGGQGEPESPNGAAAASAAPETRGVDLVKGGAETEAAGATVAADAGVSAAVGGADGTADATMEGHDARSRQETKLA